MNDNARRKINIAVIVLLFFGTLGNGFFMYKTFVSYKSYSADNVMGQVFEKIERECDTAFKRSGFRVVASEGAMTVSKSGLNKYMELIAKSSMAIKECPGYRLERFCMGTDCATDFEMVLRKVDKS